MARNTAARRNAVMAALGESARRVRARYHLTPEAEVLFPKTYSELTNELLDYVQDEDPAMVDRVFERRRRRRVEQAKDRLARAGTFDRRVKELTAILDADGYLADVQRRRDGTYLVTEHNCAILGVAQRYGLACSTELEFLREALPDATVERVAHKLGGAHVCAYEIRRVRLREGSGAGRRTRASGSVAPPPRGRRTPAAAGRRSLPA